MHRLVSWSLQFRFLVLIGAAAIAFFGMTQLRKQNVDILPEFAPLTVEVQAEAVGLAPAEVESLITAPLEEILSGVPWLKSMQSRSIAGLCAISLHFEDGTSLLKARQMVQERLLHTSVLPKVAKPPAMLQPKSDLNRAMQIGLSSDKLSLTEVSLLARWKIKPRLMSVPGVASVAIFGQRERQLQVEVDTEKLNARGVQLQDVIKAAGNALWVSPLTYLQQQRIKMAKELLESTNLSVGEIAYRVGYFDHGHFTRLFERALTVGPRAYRQTVRAKIFALQPR